MEVKRFLKSDYFFRSLSLGEYIKAHRPIIITYE
jgi:hypothetical protein